jgi:hypothetical protein
VLNTALVDRKYASAMKARETLPIGFADLFAREMTRLAVKSLPILTVSTVAAQCSGSPAPLLSPRSYRYHGATWGSTMKTRLSSSIHST